MLLIGFSMNLYFSECCVADIAEKVSTFNLRISYLSANKDSPANGRVLYYPNG